jgi:hypothetical protein
MQLKYLLLLSVLCCGCGCRSKPKQPELPIEHKTAPCPKCCEPKPEVVNGCVQIGEGLWRREKCECGGCAGKCDVKGGCVCDPVTCMSGCKFWCCGQK